MKNTHYLLSLLFVLLSTKAHCTEPNTPPASFSHLALVQVGGLSKLGFKLGRQELYGASGGYIGASLSSFQFGLEADFEVNQINIPASEYYEYGSTQKIEHYSFSIGGFSPLQDILWLYYGAGFGKRMVINELHSYNMQDQKQASYWVKEKEYPVQGLLLESGFWIELDRLLLQLGAATIAFQKFDFQFGLGFKF